MLYEFEVKDFDQNFKKIASKKYTRNQIQKSYEKTSWTLLGGLTGIYEYSFKKLICKSINELKIC